MKRIAKMKILGMALVMLVAGGMNEAYAQSTGIYRLQSLFLYNFTKHVKWSNSEGQTFTIGIFGNANAAKEIESNLSNKVVWGKKINVVQIHAAADVSQCQIVYIPKSNKKKILDFIDTMDLSNTLLVTEDDLTGEGAAISFVFDHSKMKFKISKARIEHAGLKVSGALVSIGIPV